MMRDALLTPLLGLVPPSETSTLIVLVGLFMLGPIILAWIRVVAYFKGERLDPALYVTKKDFEAQKADRDLQLAVTVKRIEGDIGVLSTDFKTLLESSAAIHRSLGRLEGAISHLPQ